MKQNSPLRIAPLGCRQVLVVFGGVALAMVLGSLDQPGVATAMLIATVLVVFKHAPSEGGEAL